MCMGCFYLVVKSATEKSHVKQLWKMRYICALRGQGLKLKKEDRYNFIPIRAPFDLAVKPHGGTSRRNGLSGRGSDPTDGRGKPAGREWVHRAASQLQEDEKPRAREWLVGHRPNRRGMRSLRDNKGEGPNRRGMRSLRDKKAGGSSVRDRTEEG